MKIVGVDILASVRRAPAAHPAGVSFHISVPVHVAEETVARLAARETVPVPDPEDTLRPEAIAVLFDRFDRSLARVWHWFLTQIRRF